MSNYLQLPDEHSSIPKTALAHSLALFFAPSLPAQALCHHFSPDFTSVKHTADYLETVKHLAPANEHRLREVKAVATWWDDAQHCLRLGPDWPD